MIKLTREEAADIVCDDHNEWIVVEINITGTSRWSIQYEGVFQHGPTGKFYQLCWSVGATEQQDESPFEYEDPTPVEVEPIQRLVNVWESVK